ncbi:hypothetical protein Q0M19_14505, partial [Staphylococcus aureus]|nr:hypothetical protein [Staphylococcus aureus]
SGLLRMKDTNKGFPPLAIVYEAHSSLEGMGKSITTNLSTNGRGMIVATEDCSGLLPVAMK